MIKTLTSIAAALLLAGTAQAATVDVFALGDAYGTAGAAAGTVNAGEKFTITVAANDLWDAGGVPLWSNANGLVGNLLATGIDDSGQAAGTLIGKNFGVDTNSDGSFHFGELVGRIGSGPYFAVGTQFSGVASSSGVLSLFYWDNYRYDNTGSVAANVTLVPEPGTVALLLAGLFVVGGLARRRAKNVD